MSILGIFGSSSDTEQATKLINGITAYNVDTGCNNLGNLLTTSQEINRKTLIPLLQHALNFLKSNNSEASSAIFYLFIRTENNYLKAGDLKNIIMYTSQNQSVYDTVAFPTLLDLCSRVVVTKEDLSELIENTMDLVSFASHASNQSVFRFISKVVSLDPSLRVPFVFAGLIEQIIPSIISDKSGARMLASLISDVQSRQYFFQMGHIPTLITAFFDSSMSTHIRGVFRALLSPDDLTNLHSLQSFLFSRDFPRQLLFNIFHGDISDESASNAAIVLGDCLQYYPLQNIPFKMSEFLETAAAKPSLRIPLLYVLESFAIANKDLMPSPLEILKFTKLHSDIFFELFCIYLCHSPDTKYSEITFSQYENLTGRQLSQAIITATEFHCEFPNSEVLSQSLENECVAQLASINRLVTRKFNEKDRNLLVQNAVNFFSMQHEINSGTYLPLFFPREFIDWGKSEFSEIGLSRWMHSATQYEISDVTDVYDRIPDSSSVTVIEMSKMTNEVRKNNEKLRKTKERLIKEAEESEMMRGEAELDLIEAKCRAKL
ncbi:hypothetical protein TVAG_240010 [Trichomonas vaginalis G3]|uniref:Uncharacterized protein n=1 Tax=Trichomonas vaginalis (strain ATCC PRA-98 / G3) TaxID=412133 RepID=A2EFE3_TRIV3|nr:armadillo (ARM) repeat-containing protein family [Trichomonas vaginalis G3]EAY08640.1 hypothetical protein TVAG_240010 [Trichomonas vaginalis G3]KAI5543843.1 armadillo (ARM) repeat-containing protein family [Trichomonas vaginalis G3]|eukprot:XP_001320863.1 hypothetical protein [Trichomonas vaginalis G3]